MTSGSDMTMTSRPTEEVEKLIREKIDTMWRSFLQNVADSYDETKNPAIRPIKESTFKVKRPFRVTRRKE